MRRQGGVNVVTDAGSPHKQTTGRRNHFLVLVCNCRLPRMPPVALVEKLELYQTENALSRPGGA